MTRSAAVTVFALVALAGARLRAQQVVIRGGDDHRSATILREVAARPHATKVGTEPLVMRRDSTISSGLLVVGRPTYLAGRVDGDVVVIGSDLFLRPGFNIRGRAIAIGGTVSASMLGQASGGTESFRDETYLASTTPNTLTLDYHAISAERDPTPLFQLAGVQGLLIPNYDRVNGLSLPIGALVTLPDSALVLAPRLTYRSRLGVVDPLVDVSVLPGHTVYLEGRVGMTTRTNDRWIRSDLVNSATSFFAGSDNRNYFRSRLAEGRAFIHARSRGFSVDPFVGARYERVTPVTTGSVYSVIGKSEEHMRRPNPLVEAGNIGSALLGAEAFDTAGTVITNLRAEVEQSFTTPAGTGKFTQLTTDIRVGFPTFGTQSLAFRIHTVTSAGDSVPKARFVYLGGGGSIPMLDPLEQGGSDLLFVESRYQIPVPSIVLPFAGSPVVTLKHFIGAAGVRKLPDLEQEIGVGVGISIVTFDFYHDVSGSRGSQFGVGFSFPLK